MTLRKIITVFLIWGLGGILFASQAYAEGEQWLRYNYGSDTRQAGASMHPLKVTKDRPAGVELPAFNDSQPMFAVWESPMAKGGKVHIALDRSDKKKSYDLLYIDSDCDGSLKDETPVKATSKDEYYNTFGPVKVLLEGDDGPTAYHLNFMLYKYDASIPQLYAISGCWYEGIITVGGEKKRCVLTDADADGTFNETSKNYYGADRIVIGEGPNEVTAIVGKFLQVEDKLYRLEVARDGAYIKISPADDAVLGTIKMPSEINELTAAGENGLFKVLPKNGTGSIPEGKYRIHRWVIERNDGKGDNWKLEGEDFRESADFEVKKDGTAYLAVGEPITSKMNVQVKRGKYAFEHSLTGRLGERAALMKNNARVPAPKLRVVSKDGTFDHRYSFEYG
jgi:hypothetical protein